MVTIDTSPPYLFTGVNLDKFKFRVAPICTGILPIKKLLKIDKGNRILLPLSLKSVYIPPHFSIQIIGPLTGNGSLNVVIVHNIFTWRIW